MATQKGKNLGYIWYNNVYVSIMQAIGNLVVDSQCLYVS